MRFSRRRLPNRPRSSAVSWPRRPHAWATTGPMCRPRRSPTSSGRTSSQPGRSASSGCRRTCRRHCARPSRRRPGRGSTRATSRVSRTGSPHSSTTVRPVTPWRRSSRRLEPFARANSLAAKLIQLTMPGVPDIYQGTEAIDRSLVDPDNRRPVDFAARSLWLDDLDRRGVDAEKVHLVATALRVRREHPDAFVGAYNGARCHRLGVRSCAGLPARRRRHHGGHPTVGEARLPAAAGATRGSSSAGEWREELRGGRTPARCASPIC